MPSISNLQYHYGTDEIDLMCTGDHLIGTTTESGLYFHPLIIQAVITQKSGTVIGSAICSIGWNDSSYNNMVTAVAIGGDLDSLIEVALNSSHKRIPYNSGMRIKINVVPIGGGVLKGKAVAFGFYQ